MDACCISAVSRLLIRLAIYALYMTRGVYVGIEPAIFLLEKLHCPLHFLWKEAGGRSREPASVFSFIYLSVAAPPRPASCMVKRVQVGRMAWHRPRPARPLCSARC